MNPFEIHKFKHVSPSSLNLYQNEPSLFALQYLNGMRFPVGCAAHRGSAAEEGVQAGLIDHAMPIEECQAIALKRYDALTALSGDSKRSKEREAIPGIVANAVKELRMYGRLSGYQGKVVNRFDDIPIDVLGFYDFFFEDAGIVVDLKTSLRLASEINPAHGRQVSHYVHGTNFEARICYVTPAKLACYRVENAPERFLELNNIARRLQKFLSLSNDKNELMSFLVPRVEEFWWSDPAARAAALEIYGL